ncbi:MAG: hypothetical protein LBH64_05285 [Coriobacteriales bacterium]|jgi:hypothetical protein|nr:hypothetical protein [Coriobacteriales bacterium]
MATYKKDINLLAVMRRRRPRVNPLVIVIPILVALILGSGIGLGAMWLTTRVAALTIERNDLQSYLDSRRLEDSQNQADEARREADKMTALASEVKNTLYNLSSYPDLTGEDIDSLFNFAGIATDIADFSYDRRTGTLNFTASTVSVHTMPALVQTLRGCGIFSDVQYTGYASSTASEIISTSTDEDGVVTSITEEVTVYHYALVCKVTKPQPFLPPTGDDTQGDTGGETGEPADSPTTSGDSDQKGGE